MELTFLAVKISFKRTRNSNFSILDSRRRTYQYNEDDFLFKLYGLKGSFVNRP